MPSDGATSYRVWRATCPGGAYELVATVKEPLADVEAPNFTSRWYVVTAVGNGGESGFSNEDLAIATPAGLDVGPTEVTFERSERIEDGVAEPGFEIRWKAVPAAIYYSVAVASSSHGFYVGRYSGEATQTFISDEFLKGSPWVRVWAGSNVGISRSSEPLMLPVPAATPATVPVSGSSAVPVVQTPRTTPRAPSTAPTSRPAPKSRPSTTQPLQYENCKSYDYPGRHAAILRMKADLNPQIVFIGDSITHHWGGLPKSNLGNGAAVLKSEFGAYRVLNLGFGHDRTQHMIWRLQNGEIDGLSPSWVVINAGTNNTQDNYTPEEIMAGIRVICQEVKQRVPKAQIVLMSIFPRERSHSRNRLTVNAVNALIADYAKDQKFVHLDIGQQFLDEKGEVRRDLLPDSLHPNAEGYRIWAKALLDVFKKAEQ
jgi:lysophospholipase L1-like esterase